jgi:hypothetical protein
MMEILREIQLEQEAVDHETKDTTHWQLNKQQFKRFEQFSN